MKGKKKFKLDLWNSVMIITFIFLLFFLVIPLINVLKTSFVDSSTLNFSMSNYAKVFTKKYYLSSLFNSIKVCTLATIFATLLGVPMAYLMTRYNIPCKGFIYILIIISLLMPPFIGAYSWIILLGRNGIIVRNLAKIGIHLSSIYGVKGIILVFTLQYYPHIFMYVQGSLNTIDTSLEEAAESLGVSKFRRLMTVTFPLVFPAISAGMLIVFLTSFADFGTPMLIGENYTVLSVLTYNQFISEMGGNEGIAATLGVIMVLISTLVLMLQRYLLAKKNYNMSALRPPEVVKLKGSKRFFATLFCGLVVFLSGLPQAIVVISSFMKTKGPIFYREFSLENYKSILYKVPKSIAHTFEYSTVAIIVMVFSGMLISYVLVRRRNFLSGMLDVFVMLPYTLPGTVFGIALIVSFNKKPLVLTGTWIILVISYILRKLPYTIRSSTAVLYQIDKSMEEASINLGVPPLKTFWKITAPLMIKGTASGAVLSWVTTINELSSTIILYAGATATITVEIYSQVFMNNYGTGAALASILTFTTVISILIVNKLSNGQGFNI
jgi:iron(III) transport system permease protein